MTCRKPLWVFLFYQQEQEVDYRLFSPITIFAVKCKSSTVGTANRRLITAADKSDCTSKWAFIYCNSACNATWSRFYNSTPGPSVLSTALRNELKKMVPLTISVRKNVICKCKMHSSNVHSFDSGSLIAIAYLIRNHNKSWKPSCLV